MGNLMSLVLYGCIFVLGTIVRIAFKVLAAILRAIFQPPRPAVARYSAAPAKSPIIHVNEIKRARIKEGLAKLSETELAIIHLLKQGNTIRKISQEKGLPEEVIHDCIQGILGKLGLNRTKELIIVIRYGVEALI